jgi:hypothetical protein
MGHFGTPPTLTAGRPGHANANAFDPGNVGRVNRYRNRSSVRDEERGGKETEKDGPDCSGSQLASLDREVQVAGSLRTPLSHLERSCADGICTQWETATVTWQSRLAKSMASE